MRGGKGRELDGVGRMAFLGRAAAAEDLGAEAPVGATEPAEARLSEVLDPAIDRAIRSLGWADGAVTVAERPLARLLGMIVQDPEAALARRLILAFPRCASVHTCFMRRPLDIAFLDDSGAVLELQERVAPWRFLSCRAAAFVLERLTPGNDPKTTLFRTAPGFRAPHVGGRSADDRRVMGFRSARTSGVPRVRRRRAALGKE